AGFMINRAQRLSRRGSLDSDGRPRDATHLARHALPPAHGGPPRSGTGPSHWPGTPGGTHTPDRDPLVLARSRTRGGGGGSAADGISPRSAPTAAAPGSRGAASGQSPRPQEEMGPRGGSRERTGRVGDPDGAGGAGPRGTRRGPHPGP